MRQVLRSRQLAPHGSILTPIVVITNVDNLRIVSEEFVIGTGPNDVFSGIGFKSRSIAAGARFQCLGPGFLDDIVAAQVSSDHQRIDRFAVRIQFGLDQNRLGINCCDGVNVIFVVNASIGFVLDIGSPGIGNIIGGHRGSVAPMCGWFDLEGDLGMRIVPRIITISQQRIHLPVEHVVEVRGFEHGDAGAVLRGDSHRIVAVGRVWIPTDNRAPLLTIEVQRFIAGESLR